MSVRVNTILFICWTLDLLLVVTCNMDLPSSTLSGLTGAQIPITGHCRGRGLGGEAGTVTLHLLTSHQPGQYGTISSHISAAARIEGRISSSRFLQSQILKGLPNVLISKFRNSAEITGYRLVCPGPGSQEQVDNWSVEGWSLVAAH